jgi:branched-chain amino acid transport system permease protein
MESFAMKIDLRRFFQPALVIILIYILLLVGPVAGFNIPTIWESIHSNPELLVQYLIIGLANGSIIAIIALGYTLVYGIVELINFAHGDVYMIGVFTALITISITGTMNSTDPTQIILGMVLALVAAIIVCAVLNTFIERVAYRGLRNAPRLAPLISAIGMSFIVENTGLILAGQQWLVPSFGTTGGGAQKNFPDLLSNLMKAWGHDINLLANTGIGLRLTAKDLLVIVLAGILMIGLRLFIQRTTLGKAMRATSQNRDAARMLGIDIDRVISLTFMIGGGLAGAAGLMSGLYNGNAWWFMGFRAGLDAFTAAVLGGIGNITGAMLGGLLIGLLASFSDGYLNSGYTHAWVFAILVLVLVFRPTGLLGVQTGEKA